MSALSNQQVRHMYVVTGAATAAAPSNFTSATTGQAAVFNDLGAKTAGNYAYFLYKNNKGYISKTDNIYKDQVVYAKTTDYAPESFSPPEAFPVCLLQASGFPGNEFHPFYIFQAHFDYFHRKHNLFPAGKNLPGAVSDGQFLQRIL